MRLQLHRSRLLSLGCLLAFSLPAGLVVAADLPPKSWIDPDTGHRVIRLTDEPGSASLYFNDNGFTPDGKKMVYLLPKGLGVVDLTMLAARHDGLDRSDYSELWC